MMDFGQEYYEMFGGKAGEKMPFYMAYPMRNSFQDEEEYERDCRRLQAMYPRDARKIQSAVERECDKMEYEGSMMFGEYPDRLLFALLCRNIYRELTGEDGTPAVSPDRDDPFLQLVEVMLSQEMYRRRCRRYRCRRWY
ncbi:MAG: hypothetical protein LUE90_07110 [Clostridiales bacterium]|nr:hypothetical protein [Clostridiales bacterium]